MADAFLSSIELEPGSGCEAAHAVAYDQGRQAGQRGDKPDRGFYFGSVVVDGCEYRLEVDGDKSVAAAMQPVKPGAPEPSVAEQTMDKYQAATAMNHCLR